MSHDKSARASASRLPRILLAGLLIAAAAAALAARALVQDAPRSAAAPPSDPAPARIAWPTAGVSAAEVAGSGLLLGQGAERPVPIASVAKVMTAYVILRDHPLSAGAPGPHIVVELSEAAAYPAEVRAGESVVPVRAGEVLSERQALEALLLPSADNVAWILARWDAGSVNAFVERMNAVARQLGMTSTRYTDPSGLAPSTRSSAADQVRLGIAAMKQRALAEIAGEASAVIPLAGTVDNVNRVLGQDGIVGLKTGSTSAAGGCVVLAARSGAANRGALIVVAVLGQPGSADTIVSAALAAGQRLLIEIEHNIGLSPGSSAPPAPAAQTGAERRPPRWHTSPPRLRGARVLQGRGPMSRRRSPAQRVPR
jgi:serine-type D-Ala-D-Ala carboxypeptidase (penicillin-binding protein 5/6)